MMAGINSNRVIDSQPECSQTQYGGSPHGNVLEPMLDVDGNFDLTRLSCVLEDDSHGYSFIPNVIKDCMRALSQSLLFNTLNTMTILQVATQNYKYAIVRRGISSDELLPYMSACVEQYYHGKPPRELRHCCVLLITLFKRLIL